MIISNLRILTGFLIFSDDRKVDNPKKQGINDEYTLRQH